jgi:hypothetical protein
MQNEPTTLVAVYEKEAKQNGIIFEILSMNEKWASVVRMLPSNARNHDMYTVPYKLQRKRASQTR